MLRYTHLSSEAPIPNSRAAHHARSEAPQARNRERMLHIRLDPDLHRALRVIVAEQDTTLQEWVVRTLAAAAHAAGVRDSSDDPDKD